MTGLVPQWCHVLAQGAAPEHINHLGAATDTQHRQVQPLGFGEQVLVGVVAESVISCLYGRLMAIKFRVNMGAPRQHNTIQKVDVNLATRADKVSMSAIKTQPPRNQSVRRAPAGRPADTDG